MRQSSGISVLPTDLHQQLLAMPLTADERREAAQALVRALCRSDTAAFQPTVAKNASQPTGLRGV